MVSENTNIFTTYIQSQMFMKFKHL